jgi:predicted dehydrogenase
MTMIEENPVTAALVGLGWWGRKMASLVNAGGARMHFVRGVDPSPDAAAFAGQMGLQYSPDMAEILEAAKLGKLGRLLQIEANFSHDKFLGLDPSNWRLKAEQAPAGGMTATGIHLTDLAVKLMGRATDVRVVCENLASSIPQGDTMSAHIRFAGGGTAYVSATLATPFVSRFAVFGTDGWIEVRDKAHVEAPDGWVVTEGWKNQPITVREVSPAEPVRDNLRAFARAVRGEADYPITGEDMINNIALLEAIVRSAQSGALVEV